MSRARHARRILEPIAAAAKRGGGGAFAAPRVAGFVATRSAAGSSSSSPSRIGGFFRCDLVPSSARFRTDHRAPHLARGIAASPHLAADNAADAKKKADDEDAKTPGAADPTDPTDPDPDATTHAFQAETRRLLDIVTNSLYTDKEVFVRELVSNASDALEKCRHAHLAKGEDPGELVVAIDVDDEKRTFTISDTGLGMTADELRENLGTIARSGSKAFVDSMKDKDAEGNKDASASASSTAATNIIGKFGVGFYSSFMVSDVVDVYSSVGDGVGNKWSSAGDGTFALSKCEVGEGDGKAPKRGTKIVLHVKEKDKTIAASKWAVESTLKKYSAFVGFPVLLNGKKTNDIDALWTKKASEVSDEDAAAFYRFVGGAMDSPAFRLHFSADAPLTIRALLFAPSENPEKGFAARQLESDQSGLSLYSRRVLIQGNARGLLPPFMRWVRGVVDCEDVPLNISRESLQDSDLIRRLGDIIAKRMIKHLTEQAKKEPEKYAEWYAKLGVFLKEGICGDQSYLYKDLLVPLLRFETSAAKDEKKDDAEDKDAKKTSSKPPQSSLDEYVSRMPEDQKAIYYLVTTGGRKQAEASPYLEAMKAKGYEVLFLYAHVDEFVMQHVRKHKGKDLVSVEIADVSKDGDDDDAKDDKDKKKKKKKKKKKDESHTGPSLGEKEMTALCDWFATEALPGRVTGVKPSARLVGSPALLTGHEPEAMRRYRMMLTMMSDEETAGKLNDLQNSAALELNPSHPVIRAIEAARNSDDDGLKKAAKLAAEQVFDNARISAGAMDDPREMVGRIHELLELALPKSKD